MTDRNDGFDPSPEAMLRHAERAFTRAIEARVGDRDERVFTKPDAETLRALVRSELPRAPGDLDALIDRFFDDWLPVATRVDHPRFFAFVPAPGSFQGALGAWLAAATNLFAGSFLGGTFLAELEVQVLEWLAEAMGLPDTFGHGILTSGGSLANLTALGAARDACDARLEKQRIYTSSEAHYSVQKAARVLGYRDEQIVEIPVDFDQRMNAEALRDAVELDVEDGHVPAAVIATAGTTSTGATDPIVEIARLCNEHDLWLHVDAAYGGAMALLEEETALREALGLADSITLDPHKWLYAPLEQGCLLTRRPQALRRAFHGDGAYLQDVPRDEINFFEYGPELSRGARSLKLWLLLASVGFDAIAEAVRNDCRRAQRAEQLLAAHPSVSIATPTRMSVFSFHLGDEARTQALLDKLFEDGFAMLSSTRVHGAFALRICVVNHRTSDEDIDSTCGRIVEMIADLDS